MQASRRSVKSRSEYSGPLSKGYLFGVACVLAGGLCLSLAGVLVRHIEHADGWQILFFRSVTFFIMLSSILAVRYRSRTLAAFRAVGWRGLVVSLSLGLGSVCYIFALLNTTVANAMFIIGASPLVAAAAGWILLGERVSALKTMAESAAIQADAEFIHLAGELAEKTELAEAETWTPAKAIGLEHWVEEEPASAVVALVLFGGLCFYLFRGGRSAAGD